VRTRLVRRYATAPLALVVAAALTSCSVGVEAGTLDPQRLSGAKADAGQVKVRNALIVAPTDEGDDYALIATIINDGTTEDTLTGVEVAGPDGPVDVDLRPSTVDLAPETAVVVPGESDTSMSIEDLDLEAGTYVQTTFRFETAGVLQMSLLVLSEVAVYGGN